MDKKYAVYFKEETIYMVEIEVEEEVEEEAIAEIARQKLEDNGRENHSVDTSGLTLESVEELES